MSSKSQKAEKAKAALEAKVEQPKKDFIPMPKAFNQSALQIMQQAQMRIQDRVSSAMDLNKDIPKNWIYDLRAGGFTPPPPAPAAGKREKPSNAR